MNIFVPNLTLTFLGNDLPIGHSVTQIITDSYIVERSIKRDSTLMSGLKSASNQVTLSLTRDCPSVEDIIATDGDIKAVLSDGATTLFTGYISTSFSWKVTQHGEQVFSITLEDTSTRLLTKPFIDTGYHLFNTTASNAISAICEKAGITVSSSAMTILDNIIYVAEAGKTCKELLEQMLYELGYVYYCDNLGELRFFKIDVTSLNNIPSLDKDDLYNKGGQIVNLSKKIRQYRSVRMTYTAIGSANNYLVYRNTTAQDDGHPYCNLPLQSGEHFDGLEIYTAQEWAAETADQFREPALVEACNAASETDIVGSNKIIAISNLNPIILHGSHITASMTAAGGPYIEINAENTGSSTEAITRMDLYASILYEKSQNIVRTGISGNTTDSLYTEDCSFIHSKELMTRHANLVCQYNAYCNSRYTFYSDTNFELGSLIHLNENVFSGLAVDVMIIAKAESDKSSVVQYTAIGVSVFSLTDNVYHQDTTEKMPSIGLRLIDTLPQYYHSHTLDNLVPNLFVITTDAAKQTGKIYYEEKFTLESRFVPTSDAELIEGKTYYEDASWIDEIVDHSGNGYFVNGRLVPTQDTSKQTGKTYYYYDETDEEYEEFTGSTFVSGTTYYEFVEYPSYVWHRQKYVYSNGDIAYSSYAYYLTTADVANPFTITTLYGVSTGTEMIPTTDVSQIEGKEYYVITNGKYVKVGASGSFPVGTTVYEIPGFIGWSEGIPSAWRKGLYVWYKETTVYDNQPENTLEDSPKYSVRFTQEMEANCAFEGTLQDYTWNKNMRSMASEDVAVNIAMKIVGYGAEATPIVRGLPSAVSVTSDSLHIALTFDSNINANSLDFTIGLLYPTEDSTPQGGKTYYYYDSVNNAWAIFSGSTFLLGVDYYEDYPNVESLSFTINSVDITEKAMYLGLQSALPTSSTMYFLDGDHFVPTQNIVVGAITYYKYMPYVYSGGSWVAVQDGQTYGKETSVQIMYDCAKDIYHNAVYTYTNCSAGDVAIAGVTYYNQTTLQPVVVAEGEDVSPYCTRHLDVPQEVIDYYNYQEKLMAEHIVAEDIELARGGKIRSAGYVKGTAQKIMDEMAQGHTVENYQPGFYGDYEGNFEAYAAVLVDANIYYCNIVGELRNELFETVTSAVAGAEYSQNTLVDESWSADEGIKAAQDAGMSNDTFTAISCQLNNTSYNYGMIVPDPEKTVDVNNIDPDDTRTMPIKAQLSSVTGRIFVNNTEVTEGSTVAYGAAIKNKERWLMDTLYNNSSITADKIVASNISWGGNSYPYIARITNPSATMISAWSQSATLSTGPRTSETVRVYIPDWFNGATCSCSMVAKCCAGIFSKEWYGDIDISKNGSSVIGGPVGSTYGRSATFTVNAGDYIDFYFGWVDQAYAARNGSYSISVSAQSCSALGFSSKGFYTFSYSTTNSKKRVSSISNRGTTGDHFQSDLSVSMTSPISWASANHCELASFSYTYGLYDAGFNFLNSSAEKQASLTSGMKPIATRFAFANFNSNSWDSNNANNHYFHLNSSPLKTGSTPVQSAKIFSIDHGTGVTCSFSYQRKGEALRSGTDIKSVIWSAANVTIERDNGIEILQIGQNNWYKSFTIDFTALAKSRGNYAESIYPMKGEADRTTEIKLGLADNRFDEVHTKKLGNRFQGTEEGYINNLNLIPQTGISSFITGVTYYYFDNGILVPESSSTPVSGRQYFILGSAANYAYFDTLAMLDSMDNQKKRIDNLFVKLAQVEQSLSGSTTMIPSSKAVTDAIMNIVAYEDITCSTIGGGRWLYGRISNYTNHKLVSVFLLSKIEDSVATFLDYSISSSSSEEGSFSIRTGNSTATTGMKVRALTIRK